MVKVERCAENPVVTPGKHAWRKVTVFNPGVLLDDGVFYLYERAAGSLRPHMCSIGLLTSRDGVHFEQAGQEPIITGEMFGCPYGSVQDPRVVRIGDTYYMIVALRPYSPNCNPTGEGGPLYEQGEYPGFDGDPSKNRTRSAILLSDDRVHWRLHGYTTSPDVDDRDNVLFPEKIGGQFVLFRRPDLGPAAEQKPSMWLCTSEDLRTWSEPRLVAAPESEWEGRKIGASTPPLRTDAGWLVLYHGVDAELVYRVGAMLLDGDDPSRVIARPKGFLMEPEAYYERFGLVIPNVVFPTGNVVKDGVVHIYYGCCDTAIGLATIGLTELLEWVRS